MSTSFSINGIAQSVDVDPSKPLLWVIREQLSLSGTKFGWGIGQCGACTVHVDGQAIRSCLTPVSSVEGKEVTTREGLVSASGELHPVQQAWVDHQVPQCGYCQSGQIMTAAALLDENPNPTESEIDTALSGNICRCGCYPRIKKAVLAASSAQPLFRNAALAQGA